ncbi:MAG: SDR family NAD(P)-dependent oxidoreductase [Marinosulfonomonas sp.]|nr:SDR family NAD(P)-dependent oxidoreductase [Marinosulfonomonas sp.]
MAILITGANRGVGRALFDGYSAAGRQVIGTARTAGDDFLPLDVTQSGSHAALASSLAGQEIDLLICNAGVYLDQGQNLADGYPAEMWAQAFATNVTGVFSTIQNLLPNLRQAATPKIAIISSHMGSQENAPGGSYIYRASKAAALNLGRNLASDLKADGISVGIYHPGWVQTDMGGPSAMVTPAQSAKGLSARFDALSLDTTGCFETFEGQAIAF